MKTVLSSQAVQKLAAGGTALTCGPQFAIPGLGTECVDI